MEIRAFARYALPLLLAAALLITAGSVFAQEEERKGGTPAEITKACKNKKPGKTVKVRGKYVTCQTPTPEVANACKNKNPGDIVRVGKGEGKQKACPPACCYINGCMHPQNRDCL
jgi:hypothetical protein